MRRAGNASAADGGVTPGFVNDAIATAMLASPTDTIVEGLPFTITAGGTWSTLISLPIANSTKRDLFMLVSFAAGTPTAPQSAFIWLLGTATRSSAGVITVSSLSAVPENLSLGGIQYRLNPGVGVVQVQFRKAAAPATTIADVRYGWREQVIT